ncbi:hypothetical protein ACHAWT_009286 [Skeletonema menzelii]
MTTTTVATANTLLILLSVVLSSASSPLSPSASIASACLTNDDGSSPLLRCLSSSPPSFKTSAHTTSSTTAAKKSSLSLVNELRGGGWRNKNNEDEYEYYEEEYYDEYGDDDYMDEYAEYYEHVEEEDSKPSFRSNKKSSSRSVQEEDEEEDDDYNYVIGTPATTNKDDAKKQTEGSRKIFGFGGSNKSDSRSKNKTNKQASKRSGFMSTSRVSKASFVPSFRAPSYSARGGGHSLSGTTAAISALFSRTTSILCDYVATLSKFVMTLLQPIGSSLRSMAYYTYSTLSHWIILSVQLLRDVLDMIWYGPAIDGITTTGVMSRYGGLQSILFGSPLSMVVSAVVGVGLMSWMMNAVLTSSSSNDEVDKGSGSDRIFRPWTWLRFGRRSNMIHDEEEEEEEIDINRHYSLEPPTQDEELEFISRAFKSANPSSKQRISETIATSNQGFLRRLTNRLRLGGEQQSGNKSPRRQRKMTVKSIQKWWKRDSNMDNGGQPINIIKPNHSRYSSKNKNPSINQLQNQLHKSEQERYQLQNDVQKLQLRLQKAHSDARNIASQNKWLEKQTSRADQILNRAVEVERKKANEEVERVRGEMKGVLERERLMMRGNSSSHGGIGGGRSLIGGGNDIDLNRGPTRRVMDGVKIVRDVDDYDEDDMLDEHGRPPWRAM